MSSLPATLLFFVMSCGDFKSTCCYSFIVFFLFFLTEWLWTPFLLLVLLWLLLLLLFFISGVIWGGVSRCSFSPKYHVKRFEGTPYYCNLDTTGQSGQPSEVNSPRKRSPCFMPRPFLLNRLHKPTMLNTVHRCALNNDKTVYIEPKSQTRPTSALHARFHMSACLTWHMCT